MGRKQPKSPQQSSVPVSGDKQNFFGRELHYRLVLSSANSRDCNNSVIALRSKLFKGSFSGLPYDFLRIICTDDGEELLALV